MNVLNLMNVLHAIFFKLAQHNNNAVIVGKPLSLKLKLQYFGHLMGRAASLEKALMLGKIEGKRSGPQRMRWLDKHH